MSFAETRLDLGIDYGTRASLRFNTTVLVAGDGAEQRNANWSQPLGKWMIGDRSVSNTELDYFLDFHAARKGSYFGFRFKDWTDYQAKSQPLGTGDGSKTQFQLFKTYTIGSNSVARPILKPVGNTVKIYINGIQLNSGWSVDLTNGVITFTTAPNNGVAITADFEFDVPVRFLEDKIDFRFDAYEVGSVRAIFQLQNLSLVETRLNPTINIPPSLVPVSINEVLDLGYDYGTVGSPAYNTAIATVGAGYEKRTSNWGSSRGKWQIGDRTLTRAELDYFIAFFRVVRGSAVGFKYKDWASVENKKVRFENDSIEFRFDAIDLISNQAIFYLSGISAIKTIDFELVTYNSLTNPTSITGTNSCYPTFNCVNGACVPVAGSSGRYKTLAECQSALIPPSFTGGQCNTLYDVTVNITYRRGPDRADCTGPFTTTTVVVRNVSGKIEGLMSEFRGAVSGGGDVRSLYFLVFLVHDGGKIVTASQTGSFCLSQVGYSASIQHIARVDGLPDNCGNLASTCPV